MSYSQITGGEGEIQHCKWISALSHWFMQKNKCKLTLVEKCKYYNCFSFALNANYYDQYDSCLVFSIYSLYLHIL